MNSSKFTLSPRYRILSGFLLCLLATTNPAAAQMASSTQPGVGYSGSMGSVTVGEEQLYRLAFRPDIPLGNWGLALDIELFLENDGSFSDRGWEFGTSAQTLDTILRKIYYLRYGRPKDDIYLKVGALDRVTLGYGLIVSGYRNTLQYPGIKKTGLEFKFDRLGSSSLGMEGFINNFQDFQEGGALVGLRLFGRPAGKLELGLSYVVDLDQYGGLLDRDGDGYPDGVDAFPNNKSKALDNDRDGTADSEDLDDDNDGGVDIDAGSGLPQTTRDELERVSRDFTGFVVDRQVNRRNPFNKDAVGSDRFSVFGFDAAYPLIAKSLLKLKLYGQLAILLDDEDELSPEEAQAQGVDAGNRKAEGMGIAAPGLWLDAGPLEGQIEFRYFQDDFDAGYFDNLYELDRARLNAQTGRATPKDALLQRQETLSGVFGRLGTELGDFLYAEADYQYLTGADDPKQQLHALARLSDGLLENIPRLSHAQAYYQKNNIGVGLNEQGLDKDDFLESTEDTFYGYLVGLEMSSGVSLLWDTRFVFERDADRQLGRKKITTLETVFSF
ncbi:MAG: hypothetical protein GKR89_21175 [Candidatus Latescibacteria bacterium]|nr:hypothetical protein [Candidatus Latescibacterota bacterium]